TSVTTEVEAITESKPRLSIVTQMTPEPEAQTITPDDLEQLTEKPKRVRVISDSVEDAALSYLETCLSVPVLSCETRGDVVGLTRRTFVGLLDLMLIALMV